MSNQTMKRFDMNSRRSRAVIVGNIAYLSGHVAPSKQGDIASQTAETLAGLEQTLEAVGSSKSRMIGATIWLKDMADFAGMNAVWDSWIDPENPPTRACGEVRMADDRYLIEIIATAVVESADA